MRFSNKAVAVEDSCDDGVIVGEVELQAVGF